MDDLTHMAPPITGYRNLSQEEVDLMNLIKQSGKELDALIKMIELHVQAHIGEPPAQFENPLRWTSISRTHLQQGLMALTRAVAQPQSF